MNKSIRCWTIVVLIAAPVVVALFVLWIVLGRTSGPQPLWFVKFDIMQIIGTLMSLFVATLFVERAIEVVISLGREPHKTELKIGIADQERKIARSPREFVLEEKLDKANDELAKYKGQTGSFARALTFVSGLILSAVGFRILMPMIDKSLFDSVPSLQRYIFYFLDMLITGAAIGGGSEGIHQMMNAIIGAFQKAKALQDQAITKAR